MKSIKKILIGFLVFICALSALRFFCGPLIWQNLTDSGPHGLYIYAPFQRLQRNDWCVIDLPQDIPALNVKKGHKLIKQVRGISNEPYYVRSTLFIVHHRMYPIANADYLPHLEEGRYEVPADSYLFINDSDLSLDSRYLGPIPADNINCKVLFVINYDKINQCVEEVRSWFS